MNIPYFSNQDEAVLTKRFEILLGRVLSPFPSANLTDHLGVHLLRELNVEYGISRLFDGENNEIKNYLDRETHFALRREGFRYNQERGFFENLSNEKYDFTRNKILESLADRAFDFWIIKDKRSPNDNISCDLENYIQ